MLSLLYRYLMLACLCWGGWFDVYGMMLSVNVGFLYMELVRPKFSIDLCTVPFSFCEICYTLSYLLHFPPDLNAMRYSSPYKCTE